MQQIDKSTIIKHGRYYLSIAFACFFIAVGVALFCAGLLQVTGSAEGIMSVGGIFTLVVMLFLLFVLGYKVGLSVVLDLSKVVTKIHKGDYHISRAEVVGQGGCRSCCGSNNGTGILLSDGSAYADNSGRHLDYQVGEQLYLVYLNGEKQPLDVFKASDYSL